MKKILPVVLLMIAAECNSQVIKFHKEVPLNWNTFHLKGKVRSIAEFNFMELVPDKEYDVAAYNLKFDSAGNCIDRSFYMKDGALGEHYTYEYNKDGHYIEFRNLKEDGRFLRHVFKYDAQGNQIESVNYDLTGRVDYSEEVAYDKHGNYVSVLHKGLRRNYKETYVYVYDPMGRIVSLKENSGDWRKYRYNKDTVEEIYNGVYGEERIKTVYNKNQQMVLLTSPGNKNGVSKPFRNTYKYDAAGNQTEIRQVHDDVLLEAPYSQRFEYEYDKTGNWIKRTIMTLDGKPLKSVERKIEYY